MASWGSKALGPIRDLIAAAKSRADLGVSKADTAQARADKGVSDASAARGVADAAFPKAGGSLTGTLTTIRDIVLKRSDADAILRFNKDDESHFSIRRKHSNNVLEFYGYNVSAKLFEFTFEGSGLAARIDPAGTTPAHSKTVLTREKGDARYSRLGMSQALSNVTGSRSAGTTYRNTTGKPIFVMVTTSGFGEVQFQISDNGSTWRLVGYATANGLYHQVSLMIPNGHYYRIASASGPTIHSWIEYR